MHWQEWKTSMTVWNNLLRSKYNESSRSACYKYFLHSKFYFSFFSLLHSSISSCNVFANCVNSFIVFVYIYWWLSLFLNQLSTLYKSFVCLYLFMWFVILWSQWFYLYLFYFIFWSNTFYNVEEILLISHKEHFKWPRCSKF